MAASAQPKKLGDFSGLAEDYAKHRPGYAEAPLTLALALIRKPTSEQTVVDVGAGTGIWSKHLAARHFKAVHAVEPNDDMRSVGQRETSGLNIQWHKGGAEQTGLPQASADLVTMASAFHWPDFDKACAEFHRILKPGGYFMPLWNPRYLEATPRLKALEDYILELKPDLVRKSSGRSAFTDNLTQRLLDTKLFDDVTYVEARHTETMTPERYIGAWHSVNDVQVQLGASKFAEFITYLGHELKDVTHFDVVYQTRAWVARRAG